MIESILFFALGFLCAAFLAVLAAPTIWRRAVSLTRKRVAASVPLSAGELRADKDRLRAEFAMSTRRLEMTVKSLRDKAAEQVIDVNRKHEEIKALTAEIAERDARIAALEEQGDALREILKQREDEIAALSARFDEAERQLAETALEVEKLGRMYDEASLTASNRQIELVGRESELERLSTDLGALRGRHKDSERLQRETAGELKSAQDALRAEKKKIAEMERRLARQTATLSDREDKLERHARELDRLRQRAKEAAKRDGELAERLAAAEKERARLEADLDALSAPADASPGATGEGRQAAGGAGSSDADRERLEKRLSVLLRQNRQLKADLAARAGEAGETQREDALLREQIGVLASEVVALAERLEGPESAISAALAREGETLPGGGPVSIAERVRAIREAAAAEETASAT